MSWRGRYVGNPPHKWILKIVNAPSEQAHMSYRCSTRGWTNLVCTFYFFCPCLTSEGREKSLDITREHSSNSAPTLLVRERGKKTGEEKEREKSEIREKSCNRSRRICPQGCEASDSHPWCL